MRLLVLATALLIALAPPTSSAQNASVDSIEMRLDGSNTIGEELAPSIIDAFSAFKGLRNSEKKLSSDDRIFDLIYKTSESNRRHVFHIIAKGSLFGLQSLLKSEPDRTDIGMSSLRADEVTSGSFTQEQIEQLQHSTSENVIALDAIAIIVHPNNPVHALTVDQIAQIFSGEISNWSHAGGNTAPIKVFARNDGSGTYEVFKSKILDRKGGINRKLGTGAIRAASSEALSDSVSADENAIGFVGIHFQGNTKVLDISSTCGLRYKPDEFNIRSEDYPLSRRLYFYVPEPRRTSAVSEFLEYVLSPEAQSVIDGKGFTGLNVQESKPEYSLARGQYKKLTSLLHKEDKWKAEPQIHTFADTIEGATRLSVTFRFDTGSSKLDARAKEDLRRLADYVRKNKLEKRLMLLGFADIRGEFEDNLNLSRTRVEQVSRELDIKGVSLDKGQLFGFSSIAPVACGDNPDALQKNRRVEVWLRAAE